MMILDSYDCSLLNNMSDDPPPLSRGRTGSDVSLGSTTLLGRAMATENLFTLCNVHWLMDRSKSPEAEKQRRQ